MERSTKHEPFVFVLYDGIANSVTDGQVIAPLIQQHETTPDQPLFLISFERDSDNPYLIERKKKLKEQGISLIVFKKYPFINRLSLFPATQDLRKFLASLGSYHLKARGPFAGYCALNACNSSACKELTIQARGLVAEEYAYTRRQKTNKNKISLVHRYRLATFRTLERTVFGKNNRFPITIEAVSPALKEYLIITYGAAAQKITIATHDIPQKIAPALCTTWKSARRKELHIQSDAMVFVYNGSSKAWQCPDKTIAYFKQQLLDNPDAVLLILTQDPDAFIPLLQQYNISANNYRLLSVPHAHIYEYLAAADSGLIFRESDPVNWVSRPTKILEYQAVGLEIIHNNTIAWLSK